jgi:hypothetical protein
MIRRRQLWVILLQSYNCLPPLIFLKPNVLYYDHKGMPWNSVWTNLIHIYSSIELSKPRALRTALERVLSCMFSNN